MKKLLKISAGVLSTLIVAAGANSAAEAKIDCNVKNVGCPVEAECSVGACRDNTDLSDIVKGCGTNAELLEALIKSGNCSANDLKCLIDDGTCTLNDVCEALDRCETDCGGIADIIKNSDCPGGVCEENTSACSVDPESVKSLFESISGSCESKNDCGSCDDIQPSETNLNSDNVCDGEECDSENKDESENVVSKVNSEIPLCDKLFEEECEDRSDCEDGGCNEAECGNSGGNSMIDSILKIFGITEGDVESGNDCAGGQCGNEIGDTSSIEDILGDLGFDFSVIQDQPDENVSSEEPKDNSDHSVLIPDENSSSETETDYAVSAYERKVVDLVNEIRETNGLNKLTLNEKLSNVARIKSEDMRDRKYFSHTSPTYGSPFEMMKTFGITYRSAGENIAMGQRTPEEVVNAWMNSDGHRANILNPDFTDIGVGFAQPGNYWTQLFLSE